MRVSLGRVLGAALPALLIVGAVGLTSPTARAGITGAPQCGDFEDILGFYGATSDFTAFGLTVSQCSKLCKANGSDCKSFIAKTKSCVSHSLGNQNKISKKTFCHVANEQDEKECKKSFNGNLASQRDTLDQSADEAKGGCEVIRNACIADCETPPGE